MLSSIPLPIKLGGVPIGVPMPPIDAPNAAINIIAVAKLRLVTSDSRPLVRCATIDSPIGNIIAVVAVLLIHIEIAGRDRPEHEQDPRGAAANRARRQRAERNPAIETVGEHRLGQHEAADEEKDDRIGKRREDDARRRDLQDDGQHRPDERGHGERQRLGDPEDHHHQQDGRQPVCWRGQSGCGAARRTSSASGPRDEPDRPAPPIEQLFRR